MAKPTKKQIQAVQKVLYDRARLAQMAHDFQQLNLFMNLDGPPLAMNDSRLEQGDGPDWVIPATGAVDVLVLDGADRCDQIAARLLTMRKDLSPLAIPASDKQSLMTSLSEQALAWQKRAATWRMTTAPDDVNAAVEAISKHQRVAVDELAHVQPYLRPLSDFNLE